ncbi:T9SS type A sorting domain-containing protein [Winogradskyella echinorum]|uniref:T9SS type A sorting domain-containing protein n=1 Tax=Winogradskyella echinorum TaxID=538189 RepID=A0ABR6XZA3_9FLAO|nr:zinc-dependent metalloprotease family protein [Winogradskyella echinorum]MBC3845813.1 T9SS type A sorting domain-containing protein [Winogradskyella echinorum]MBC5750161.1 T9SS type A sorting domain-containing protein [Winogradskyella echinorum]
MIKNYFIKTTIFVIACFSLTVSAQNSNKFWTSINDAKANQSEQISRKISLTKEKFYQLDIEGVKAALANVGNRENKGNTIISFPNSEGKLSRYQVFEASVMAPELQAQFPNMRAYSGQGIDNPTEIVRFTITPKGLHAMFLGTSNGTQFIDPYTVDGSVYTVYAKKNLEARNFDFECGVIDEPELLNKSFENNLEAKNASDGTLRNYRIAIACTGEYTAFHGGTVTDAMDAIMVTLARVNGIYERELSITMTLVANNSSIVFTDAATDPFNNDSANILIGQSQTEINSTIGSANYDIGHTFSTGAGGLAGLGVSCNNSNKARGVTGSPQPVGDSYDIDFVAHELGHQFGSTHTFNGNQVNCSGGNRTGSSAYEPGSGSTIMAYAGICGSDNVQGNSDDYFHQKSLELIWNHITSSFLCPGTTTATGNDEPTAIAGSDYTIPGGTPYKLDGSGSSDPNGNGSLTYTWEQYDLGPSGVPTETTVTGPLVRSFTGTDDPIRYVPRLPEILNNGGISTTWEKLSTVNRTINYNLTVRDNNANGGQTDSDLMSITNVAAAGPFRVTSQSTNQIVWTPGQTETITWDVAGTTANGINTANVNILLSTDEGLTYNTVLASNVPNDGSHDITVPNVSAPKCRIMVEGAGNIFFNVNNFFFAIGNYEYQNVDVCESFTFNFGGISVPESTTTYSGYTLNVPTSLTMTDANITVDITHPNSGDLLYGFRHPAYVGSFLIRLASQDCPGSANPNIVYDDEGSAINCGTISNGDNVTPQEPLSVVDGTNSQGNWAFFIFDNTVDGTTSSINTVTIEVCENSSEPVLSTTQNEIDGLSIYPNPNNGEFNIGFNPKSGEAITVEVYDIRGRAIYINQFSSVSRFDETIRLNNAQSGVYLLTIMDGSQKVTKKIIVD